MTRDETPRRDGPPKRRKPQDRPPTPDTKSREAPSAQARQRIAKLMARAGLCSRRDAEAWIVDGRVSVNGSVLTSPALDVGPQDVILVDGAPLPEPEMTRLFLFHKPRGLVTSDYDPEGRPTIADFLRDNWPDGPRTVTIGRLDINTEGLLLLTNDGGLARLLELPQTAWVRRYRVRAKGETDQGKLDALAQGVSIDGVDYIGIEAKLDRIQGANCWLTMGLREGKNREIKRVLEHIGLEVNRLIRLSFGPFQLLDLPEGAVEEVKTRILRDQLGEALAAAAGVDFGDTPAASEAQVKPDRPKREDRPNRDERPKRDATRGGDRPLRRDGPREPAPREDDDAPAPIRERPQAGMRKHVSALRTEARETLKAGPRQRIERSETADRKSRTVRVERLVAAEGKSERPRSRRDGDRPDTRGDRPPRRDHASPSAIGKRERVARSGGEGFARDRDDAKGTGKPRSGPHKPREGAERFDRDETRRAPAPSGPKRFEAKRPGSDDRRGGDRPGGTREMRTGAGRGAPRVRADGDRDATKPRSAPRTSSDRTERFDRGDERAASAGPKRFGTKRPGLDDRRGGDRPGGTRDMREGAGRGAPRARAGGDRDATKPRSTPRRSSDRTERVDRGDERGASAGPKRFGTKRPGSGDRRGGDRPETTRAASGRARPAGTGPSRGPKGPPDKRPAGNRPAGKGPAGKRPPRGPRGPAKPKR